MKQSTIQEILGQNTAMSDKVLVEASILDATEQVLATLSDHYRSVLRHRKRPQKWLTFEVNCWYETHPLTRLVDRLGPKQVRDILMCELPKRPELDGLQLRVTIGNQKGDSRVLVLKVTSAIYPAT